MEPDQDVFNKVKEKAQTLYGTQREIWCPYFKQNIILNSDGFHHLQFNSARKERSKKVQLTKFKLLPRALEIIRCTGTVQEYRKMLIAVGKPSGRDGFTRMKKAEYWGLVAIVGEKKIKVRAVLRKVGEGNIHFWSVMFGAKIKNGQQKLFTADLHDESTDGFE